MHKSTMSGDVSTEVAQQLTSKFVSVIGRQNWFSLSSPRILVSFTQLPCVQVCSPGTQLADQRAATTRQSLRDLQSVNWGTTKASHASCQFSFRHWIALAVSACFSLCLCGNITNSAILFSFLMLSFPPSLVLAFWLLGGCPPSMLWDLLKHGNNLPCSSSLINKLIILLSQVPWLGG